jgi:hypothetical protein
MSADMEVSRLVAVELERTLEMLRSSVSSPGFAILELQHHHDRTQLLVVLAGAHFPREQFARDTALVDILGDDLWPDFSWARLPSVVEEAVAAEIGPDDQERIDAVARRLAAELGRRSWEPFAAGFCIALVTRRFYEAGDDLSPMRDALGKEAVDRFLGLFGPPAQPDDGLRVEDRAAIERLAVQRGLTHSRAREIAEDARWALMLEPDETAVSRLGGRPVLPADVPWPTAKGRPLTHLATIDLSELPLVEGRELLPQSGFVAFLADFGDDAELWEPTRERENGVVRIVASEPGAAVHEPEPPGRIAMPFRERRVTAQPRLQIREPRSHGEHVHAQLAAELAGGFEGVHQLLGHPPAVQEDPREDDDIALLHLTWDEPLGFTYLDGADLLVFGAPDDIRAGRWDRLTWMASSS